MTSGTQRDADDQRRRRRTSNEIKDTMRSVVAELALLNRQVGDHLDLREGDFACLDLIGRFGPIGPSALARRAGLHPATMTGVLDRLERGGWVVRERDSAAGDRRAITVRALRERNSDVFKLYAGMSGSMDDILAGYASGELNVIADFLHRVVEAGRTETDRLARS